MSSDGEVLEEDNTFVQYWDDWELVYYLEEVRSELASMEELLADTEEITTESDWSQHSSPQKPKLSTPEPTIERQSSGRRRRAPCARSRDSGYPVRECPFVGRKLSFMFKMNTCPELSGITLSHS